MQKPLKASFKDLAKRLSTIRLDATWEGSTLHAISKLAKANVLSAHKVSLGAKALQSRIANSTNVSCHDDMDKKLSLLSSRATAIGEFLQVFWAYATVPAPEEEYRLKLDAVKAEGWF